MDVAERREAGPARHSEIEQDQVEGSGPIAQRPHFVIGAGFEKGHVGVELRQQPAQTVSEQQVIVGDQHVHRGHFQKVAAIRHRDGVIGPDVHIGTPVLTL